MKRGTKIFLIVLAIAVVFAAGMMFMVRRAEGKLEALKTAEIPAVDLSRVEDGTYTGEYSVYPIIVNVRVTVEDYAITDIQLLKHQNGKGRAAESIPGEVVRTQSLQVDAVSGATYSSKVILLAIADALDGATA